MWGGRAAFVPLEHEHPSHGASFVGQLYFSWMTSLIKLAEDEGRLRAEDLFPLPNDVTADALLHAYKEAEAAQDHPAPWHCFVAVVGRRFCVAGALRLVAELCNIANPLLLYLLIQHCQNPTAPFSEGVWLAVALFLLSSVQFLALQHYIDGAFTVAMAVGSLCKVLVFNKALALPSAGLQAYPSGKLSNYQTKDAQKLNQFILFAHNLWCAPLTVVGSCSLLLWILGPSALAGIAVLLLLLPLEKKVGAMATANRKAVNAHSDERTKRLRECIAAMQCVKVSGWAPTYLELIRALRDGELAAIRRAAFLQALNAAIMASSA